MITKTVRLLTQKERFCLSTHYVPDYRSIRRYAIFCASLVSGALIFVDAVLSDKYRQVDQLPLFPIIIVGILTAGIITGVYCYRSTITKEIKWRRPNPFTEQGDAEILSVDVFRAIRVEEFGDEGPGFYLDAGQGSVMFVQGQYIWDLNKPD